MEQQYYSPKEMGHEPVFLERLRAYLSEQGLVYLSERQLAQLTGLSVKTLQGWRLQRCGFPYVKLGSAVRYPLGDALTYLERNTVRPAEEAA